MEQRDKAFIEQIRAKPLDGVLHVHGIENHVALHFKDLERLLALAEQATAWQPIETATKDGTWMLITREKGAFTIPVVAQWSDRATGIFNWNDTEYTYSPTHWQPLPLAPVPSEGT